MQPTHPCEALLVLAQRAAAAALVLVQRAAA